MRIKITKTVVVALVLGVFSMPAQANITWNPDGSATFSFYHVWEENDGPPELFNGAIGEAQLSVNVAGYPDTSGNDVLFTFRNIGPDQCYISNVYFYDGVLLGMSKLLVPVDGSVLFSMENNNDLPGAEPLIAQYIAGAGNVPPASNGVNNIPAMADTEWLGVIFDLQPGQTYSDLIGDLNSGDVLIGIRVHGFESSGSESFINNYSTGGFSGVGSGTEQDPYIITNVYQLQEMNNDLNAWYELGNDIDASATRYWNEDPENPGTYFGFVPIGLGSDFEGHFDGKGHRITSFYINRPGTDCVGLFGQIGSGCEIKNVGLIDVDIVAVAGDWRVGGLVGINQFGTITNCYSTGSVMSGEGLVGGLVGDNYYGTITNCYSTGCVSGMSGVGGLVGWNDGTITNCYSTGCVSGISGVGGLVGWNDGTVTNCYSMGKVEGIGFHVGGLVGDNNDAGTISNCFSTGSVSGMSEVGGLVGWNYYGKISECYSTGKVTGKGTVGGLVGLQYSELIHSYSTANINGDNSVGGLVGCNLGPVTNCYSTGSLNGGEYVGGLIGDNAGTCTSCYSIGNVSSNAGKYVGGLVGDNRGNPCTDCFWDIETSGQTTSACGTGKTTAEMKQKATFTNWDFDTVWDIVEGVTYPFLSGSNRGFPLSVPYIHQCYDTPKDFCGSHACGATSAVMSLAGKNRILPWSNEHVDTCVECGCERQGDHTNNYGNYVSKQYAYAGEIWGNDSYEQTYDFGNNHLARGAYGYIHHNPDPGTHAGHGNLIQEFLYKHGVRGYGDATWPGGEDVHDAPEYIRQPDPNIDYVKSELAKGRLLIASTNLTTAKHFVLITAYDPVSDLFIVNDPFGDYDLYHSGSTWGNYCGNKVNYAWDDMCNVGNCLNSTISIAYYEDSNNNPPLEPNKLGQFRSDGNTPISPGQLITLPTVVFKGFVEDNSAPIEARDSVRLEIELKRVSQQFRGVPTHFSDFSPNWSGKVASIRMSDISPGQYHWRARTVDIRGEESPWVSAGNNADSEADFAIGIIMYLCSPADMIVTDPDGLIISKELIQIPGAVYEEIDVNGATHDKVSIPGHKVGDYLIDVRAEPDTSPTDTYSLMVEVGGMVAILAENIPIEDIPLEPYEFESKLNRSDFDSDGDVDSADLHTLVLHWLVEDCNYPSWCEGTDLNYNGFVDFIDYATFAENWRWEKIPADFDINGDVDFADYAILANQWRQPPAFPSADIAPEVPDGVVDMLDLAVLAEHWLEGLDN